MLKDLIKLANHLDNRGLTKEANYLDSIIRKASKSVNLNEALYLCNEKCENTKDEEMFAGHLKDCNLDITRFCVDKEGQKVFTLTFIPSNESITSDKLIEFDNLNWCAQNMGEAVFKNEY